MTPRPLPLYPYSRLIVYTGLGLVLGWIIVSISLSIGYEVFWEVSREKAIPKEERIEIRDAESLRRCLMGLQTFHRELHSHVRRFLANQRQEPLQAIEVWRQWGTEWERDLSEFARRYSFSKPEDQRSPDERRLYDFHARLVSLKKEYSDLFANLHLIQEEGLMDLGFRLHDALRDLPPP